MKVKIMDYETAKAEVLARENNPYIANDKHVYGVDRTWEGWGQVRDVYKNLDYFHDVKNGFELPNYLITDVAPEDVLRYGEVIINEEFYGEVIINEEFVEYGSICIRIISYGGSVYYHKMVNDDVVEFKKIGLAMK